MDDYQLQIQRIFEKLEEITEKQAELSARLEVHVATETQWQENTTEKLDTHIDEHRAASNVWRKGVVGAVFMILGTLVVWAASFIWTHSGKAS